MSSSEEFGKVTLMWCQRYIGHLVESSSENGTFHDIVDGYLAVYLEAFIAWIPTESIPLEDIKSYEAISKNPFIRSDDPIDIVMDGEFKSNSNSPAYERCRVNNPSSYLDINLVILYIKQIRTIKIELFISDDLSEAYPLINVGYFPSSGQSPLTESFVMKHGNPISFIESIGCHVRMSRKGQTYILNYARGESQIPQKSVVQNLFRRISFDEQIGDSVSNITWSTLGAFSSLTRLSRDLLFNNEDGKSHMRRPSKDSPEYLEAFSRLNIPKSSLPKSSSWDPKPLSRSDLTKLSVLTKDDDLQNDIKQLIYSKGIAEELRPLLWPLLLGIPDWSLDDSRNADLKESLKLSYASIKAVWSSIPTIGTDHIALHEQRRSRIVKDVLRTDRTIEFYNKKAKIFLENSDSYNVDNNDIDSSDNSNCHVLRDILLSYCYYNPSLEYVQGMSDLLSPILYVVKDESLAFWLFVQYMHKMERNFQEGGEFIKKSLEIIEKLVRLLLPVLYKFLSDKGREFVFSDILSLWERMWTGIHGQNMWMFICVGILEIYQEQITKCAEFDDILQFVNGLSGKIDLQASIEHAELQYYRFKYLMQYIEDDDLKSII